MIGGNFARIGWVESCQVWTAVYTKTDAVWVAFCTLFKAYLRLPNKQKESETDVAAAAAAAAAQILPSGKIGLPFQAGPNLTPAAGPKP